MIPVASGRPQRQRVPPMKQLVLILALTATAPIATNAQPTEPREPRSCPRMHQEMSNWEHGMSSCDQQVIARLEAQCQRGEKRLPRETGTAR